MLAIYLVGVVTLSALYLTIYISLMGSPVVAEWWLGSTIKKKEMLLDEIKDNRRLIIISGSNSLFGINSKLIEQQTGIKTFNFGMHAGLDIDYLRFEIERIARKGDIVVMPLEYSYYYTEKGYSEWFIENILSWGNAYFWQLGLVDKFRMVIHTPLRFIAEQASMPFREVTDNASTIRKMHLDGVYRGYSYKSINDYGDIRTPATSTKFINGYRKNPDLHKASLSYTSGKDVSSYTVDKLKKINNHLLKIGASLYITWPASVHTIFFNGDNPSSVRDLGAIKHAVAETGIGLICSPFDFNFPPEYFYDTNYHLNAIGQEARSKSLAKCINQHITSIQPSLAGTSSS